MNLYNWLTDIKDNSTEEYYTLLKALFKKVITPMLDNPVKITYISVNGIEEYTLREVMDDFERIGLATLLMETTVDNEGQENKSLYLKVTWS